MKLIEVAQNPLDDLLLSVALKHLKSKGFDASIETNWHSPYIKVKQPGLPDSHIFSPSGEKGDETWLVTSVRPAGRGKNSNEYDASFDDLVTLLNDRVANFKKPGSKQPMKRP